LEKLQLTADLSHWCVVLEHVPDLNDPRDDWWGPLLDEIASRTRLIHARVGFAEGPQVADPRAPEFAPEVTTHMMWWKRIWASQRERGFTELFAEPEFGPAPYHQILPYTQVPTSNLWDVNAHIADLLKTEFETEFGAK
jgi:hypothetical protein